MADQLTKVLESLASDIAGLRREVNRLKIKEGGTGGGGGGGESNQKSLTTLDFSLTDNGAAELVIVDGVLAWAMSDSATDEISTSFEHTADTEGSSIEVKVFWMMETATAGNVVLQVEVGAYAAGEEVAGGASDDEETVAVPGTAQRLAITTLTCSTAYEPGDLIRLIVKRQGGDGGDTAAGNLLFLAATVTFA